MTIRNLFICGAVGAALTLGGIAESSATTYSDTDALYRLSSNDNCSVPGSTLCVEVQNGNLPANDYSLDTPPFGDVAIIAQGAVNHVAGEISASIVFDKNFGQLSTRSSGDFFIFARDTFVVTGPTAGENVLVPGQFAADGFIFVSASIGSATIETLLKLSTDAWDETLGNFTAFGTAGDIYRSPISGLPAGDYPFNLAAEQQFLATTGTPFEVVYALRLLGSTFFNNENQVVTINSLTTGRLTFDLPDGYSISSELGYNPIPVPAALPLFASAVTGLGVVGWCRRRIAAQRPAPRQDR